MAIPFDQNETPTTAQPAPDAYVMASGSTISTQLLSTYTTFRDARRTDIAEALARWGVENPLQTIIDILGPDDHSDAFGRCAETLPYICLCLAAKVPDPNNLQTVYGLSLKVQEIKMATITQEKKEDQLIPELLAAARRAACGGCRALMRLPQLSYLDLKAITGDGFLFEFTRSTESVEQVLVVDGQSE